MTKNAQSKSNNYSIDQIVFSKWMEKNPATGIEKNFMTSAEISEALEGIFTFTVYEIAELMHENGYKFELESSSGQYKWIVFKP